MASISDRRGQRRYSPISLMPMHYSIYLKIIILIANESAWSLAESISKGNATSVRSPGSGSNDRLTSREPIGFRKIQFSNDSFQVVQLSISGAALIEDFTACAWLKLENTTSNLTLLSYHPRDGDKFNPNGALRWWISNGGSSIRLWLKDKLVMKRSVKLGDGKWRHICQDWKGSSGHWALHISGLKSLSGAVDQQGRNWTLPGKGCVRISSENGGEIYGFTLARQENVEKSKRGSRQIRNETNANETSLGKTEKPSESESEDEEKPEVFNATAEALFWNRGSSRQVETRGSSLGRAAAFLTRVIAFAIIPAMAIINEMRKNRAKNNEVKNIDSNDDDFNFKISDPTTTKAPETKITSTTPFNFDNFDGNFGNVNNENSIGNNNGNNPEIDPFFANDEDFFRSAENKHVLKTSNQTKATPRSSRSYSSQCQSSQLLQRGNLTSSDRGGDLVLAGSHCCWPDPPPGSVLLSWFHTPVDNIQGAKLVNVSKSTCGTY